METPFYQGRPQRCGRARRGTCLAASLSNRGIEAAVAYLHSDEAFGDRREAGSALAARLAKYKNREDLVVLALPRGGVPVAWEVARALDAPMDVFLVRKLGVPGYRELAMGAIASGGVRVLNADVVGWYGIPEAVIDEVAREEQAELERRERVYRAGRPPVELRDRIVILIDDGLATGSTMRAAVKAARTHVPKKVVVAVPVGAAETCREFIEVADEVVCARTPSPFSAVGQWYRDFSETTDDEVRELLAARAESLQKAP
jgi:putative phosphoribosyl transferase